jgi:hypothetical protein
VGRSIDRLREHKLGEASLKRGGPKGQAAAIPGTRDREHPGGRRTQGRLRGAREGGGGFPNGFPPHVEDFNPSHRLPVIEPTAGGQHREPRHIRKSRQQGGQTTHDL